MQKKQIFSFFVLVVVTFIAGYFILGASDSSRDVQVKEPIQPVILVVDTTPDDNPVSTTTNLVNEEDEQEPIEPGIKPPGTEEPVVTDFFSCIDVTGTILESYPRQCVFKGQTFVEQIQELISLPGDGITLTVEVGPKKVNCVGVSDQACLVVDGDLFYDVINGFEHEVGYRYTLQIERTLRWGTIDPEKIPADAGLYQYSLVEVLARTKEEQEGNGCVVAGCSSQLCISQEEMDAGGGISTCEFREEYACYRFSECKTQASGECGWTMTPEVTQCLENPPTLQ